MRANTSLPLPATIGLLAILLSLGLPNLLRAQGITPPQRLAANVDPAINGHISIRLQEDTGAPFTNPATITVRSYDMTVDLVKPANPDGQIGFDRVPTGYYLVQVTSPGYNTVREQITITAIAKAPELVAAMIPDGAVVLSHSSSLASVPPKAVKETEKGLHAMQTGKLDETQQHLTRALTYAPNFADGNYLMGVLFLRRKASAQALPYLQKAVTLAPTHAPALLALGQAQYLQGDFPHATESLKQSLHEQPGGPQAATVQELLSRIRELPTAAAAGVTGNSSTLDLGSPKISVDTLRDLAAISPVTESNWLPPDVDQQKLVLDPGVSCQLDDVIRATGDRVKELVENVTRFTATENVEHFKLSPLGLQISRETRKFDYLVEIRPFGVHDLDVQEYRNGTGSAQQFPGHIGTNGLPTLALVFHPYYQGKYEYVCEGRGVWRNTPAWLVHFQQRSDQQSAMLVYRVGANSYSVGLKGRAWIDAATSQILAIETDTMRPVPEIRLMRDHQLIEYGPVSFKNDTMHLWLPKSADWYSSLSGQRYHRRHTFSHFLLFSVDDSQKINKPKDADDSPKDPTA